MARFWTCHWPFRSWRPDVKDEGEPVYSSWSNHFLRRGVAPGDIAYIISMSEGQLYLGGRMTVRHVLSRSEYARLRGLSVGLFDNAAKECILDEETGTLLHLRRRLSPELTKRIRVQTSSGVEEPFFVEPFFVDEPDFVNEPDMHHFPAHLIRELTPESAAILDRIIEITDQWPESDQLITVTEELLLNGPGHNVSGPSDEEIMLAEEVPSGSDYCEGRVQQILVNRYERDPRARSECIRIHGTKCVLCGFDFVAVYGDTMIGFIHVHHLVPISSCGESYKIDPIRDLQPVCPNCHAVIHRRDPPYSLDEVREMLEANGQDT